MKKDVYKSILVSFLNLLLCLSLAAIATWLTAQYMQRHPSGSSEGSGWSGMADALSMGVMAGIYLVLALVFWTILVSRQKNRIQNAFLAVAIHLILLAIVVFFYIALLLNAW